jgi:hypothetical protein
MHKYMWTAPMTDKMTTFSGAQAIGPTDNYHTATVRRQKLHHVYVCMGSMHSSYRTQLGVV